MPFAIFLKSLLSGFVDVYRIYFHKTFVMALILSLICFLLALVLMACTDYGILRTAPVSIVSFFYSRYSYSGVYQFVDLTKTVFVFLAAIYSINIIRNEQEESITAKSCGLG